MNARIRDYCLRRGCSVFEVEGGLDYLVRAWERTVADVARGYPGLLSQQFANDMRIRQILHEIWPFTVAEERQEYGERLRNADSLFMQHTMPAEVPVAVGSGGGYASADLNRVVTAEQWWYNREPRVRDEDW